MTENQAEYQPDKPEKELAVITAGEAGGLIPRNFEGMWRMATIMAKSGMMPKGMEKVESVFVAIQMGLEVGLSPMQAVQNIAVINGRPSIWGDAAIGLVMASGKLEEFDETLTGEPYEDSWTATCTAKRKGRAKIIERTFTYRDARQANLLDKPIWKQYPQRMLQMRARSWALRDGFADVLKGLVLREEAQDITLDAQPDGSFGIAPISTVKEEIEKAAEKERQEKPPIPDELTTEERPPGKSAQEMGALPKSPEAEADVERNALIKTFDARVEKTGIPGHLVADYLFDCLEHAKEEGFDFETIPDLKTWTVKQKRMDRFIENLQEYATKKADEEAAGEEGQAVDPMPEGLEPGDPDWRELSATEVIATFMRDRNPGYFRVKIRKHPEVMYCDEMVVKALRKKWKTTVKSGEAFGGKFHLDTFWATKAENAQAEEPEPPPTGIDWITNAQHEELDNLIVNKWGIGWGQFLKYAGAQDAIVTVQDGDMTLRKIKYASAVEFLADPDKTKKLMVQFFTEQDKNPGAQ